MNDTLTQDTAMNLTSSEASSQNFTMSRDMVFGEAQVYAITFYSILFAIGFTANVKLLRYSVMQMGKVFAQMSSWTALT